MTKKIGWIVLAVVVVFAVFAISMRRARMMGGGGAGAQQNLIAVSADGAQVSPSADVISVTGAVPQNAAVQKSGEMIVLLALNPYPPSVGAPSEFDVTLTDLKGNPINDAAITLNLTMPSMWMPPNQPVMQFVSDGKYQTIAPFTMRGGWRIEVVITRSGASQSAFFDVGL